MARRKKATSKKATSKKVTRKKATRRPPLGEEVVDDEVDFEDELSDDEVDFEDELSDDEPTEEAPVDTELDPPTDDLDTLTERLDNLVVSVGALANTLDKLTERVDKIAANNPDTMLEDYRLKQARLQAEADERYAKHIQEATEQEMARKEAEEKGQSLLNSIGSAGGTPA